MNKTFWKFIEDCAFSKSACQVDVSYFNLTQKGYKHLDIIKFKNEFRQTVNLLKGDNLINKAYVVSKGKTFFENFLNNKSVDDLEVELLFDFELSDFSLIFTDIPRGDCYPTINDDQNLFFAFSVTNPDVLLKTLLVPNLKNFLIEQISGRSVYSKKTLRTILNQQNIENF